MAKPHGIPGPGQPGSVGMPIPNTEHLPLDAEFQGVLLKLLFQDREFSSGIGPYLAPVFFSNPAHRWAWEYALQYQQSLGGLPTLGWLINAAAQVPHAGPLYQATIVMLRDKPVTDDVAVRQMTLDFVKRNVFKQAVLDSRDLYNSGKYGAAYDLMRERMSKLDAVSFQSVSRGFWAEQFAARHIARQSEEAQTAAIPTGIPLLDAPPPHGVLDGGLRKGEVGIWLSLPKAGKALAHGEPVLTPTGWVPIEKLQVGDHVIGGSSGKPVAVLGVFPQGAKACARVGFDDGAHVLASQDHLWSVQTRETRVRRKLSKWKTVTTSELLCCGTTPRVPTIPALLGKRRRWLLDPYILGLLLGDGSLHGSTILFHKPERDLWAVIERGLPPGDRIVPHNAASCPYISITRPGTTAQSSVALELTRLGLRVRGGDKFVPDQYKWADTPTRLAVLSGLCDTDGWVQRTGCAVQFSSASRRLADDVIFLTRSLGGTATIRPKVVLGNTYWVVALRLPDQTPVRSVKNKAKVRTRTREVHRHVVSVEPVGDRQSTCIQVDDPAGLFVTRDFIVTHNTSVLCNLGATAVRTSRKRALHVILEGSLAYVEARYDTILTGELYSNVKHGHVDSGKYTAAFAEMQQLRGLMVFRDFTKSWDTNITHVDAELRDLKRGYGWEPDLILLDYVDLMRSRFRHDSEYEEQKAAVQDVKTLAGHGYAIWTASQVQRPKDDKYNDIANVLRAKDIADCYAKIRVADFIGSINQTTAERKQNWLRLYAELYRDGPSDVLMGMHMDFATMTMSPPPTGIPGAPPKAIAESGAVQVVKPLMYASGTSALKQLGVGK